MRLCMTYSAPDRFGTLALCGILGISGDSTACPSNSIPASKIVSSKPNPFSTNLQTPRGQPQAARPESRCRAFAREPAALQPAAVSGKQPKHFLKQTVAHEVAHLIAHQLFGDRIQPHGEEWQLIMRGVYELPPDRCHTYDVQRRQRDPLHLQMPMCRQRLPFSSQRHSLVRLGRRYLCRRCRQNSGLPAKPGWNKASSGAHLPTF